MQRGAIRLDFRRHGVTLSTRLQELASALEACRRSLELEDSFEGQKLLGQILQSTGQIEEARAALEAALSLGGAPEERRFIEALLRSIGSAGTR